MAFFKKFRDAQRPCCAALVAAAGSSSRMGGVNIAKLTHTMLTNKAVGE